MTNGVSINTRSKHSLWKILADDRHNSDSNLPSLKTWCATHRGEVAWRSVCTGAVELQNITEDWKGLLKYFRTSGIRTTELRQIASQHNVTVLPFPHYFEVKWTEFTQSLMEAVWHNWRGVILYLKIKTSVNKEAQEFLKKWMLAEYICFHF